MSSCTHLNNTRLGRNASLYLTGYSHFSCVVTNIVNQHRLESIVTPALNLLLKKQANVKDAKTENKFPQKN